MSGTVVEVLARKGQTLNATQQTPTILQIADLSVMTVQAQVSEADVNRLKHGMEAYFTTLGDQNRRWTGQLRRIEPTPQVENNVVLYNALFDVENSQSLLFPQMTAQVFFIIDRAENVPVLPVGALRKQVSTSTPSSKRGDHPVEVVLVNPGGETQRREVTTGLSNRVQIEIVAGLELGDRVELPGAATSGGNRPQASAGAMRVLDDTTWYASY
ncbi:HlyD family efflux transporter periplasmic adaptor subunit [Nitrincola sp. A-D6]|uniref:HlyD family efflux transporter periplasmic adaptor subunit n=1 Tax=Nitrincola sp. A-D6 TaxID=1545442 RepID=UPI0006920E36|nr:HlyD family efflux transporter periplasmic adaptor subunit [Nitrincola sp. A-D6]